MSSNTVRRALAAFALAALVVTAGCAGAVDDATGDATSAGTDGSSVASGGATDSTDGNAVSVAATGSVTADPDRAVIHVAATTTADSADAARRRTAENVSAIRRALADAGVSEKRVTTEYYNIRRTDESRNRQTRAGYRAVHALAIEVADVSRVGEVIRIAVENGASDVRHVEYTLSEETRDELRDRALTQAMSNAREDASVLASNANLTISGVRTVATSGADVRPYRAELTAAAAGDAGGATRIDSGPVTVTANVDVTYEATD